MRRILAAAAIVGLMVTGALAADADGKITKVDAQKMTIQLDNGKVYKLPSEVDMSVISEGVEVVIAYDVKNGVNQITDMFVQ